MVIDKFNMVDMGGIDILESQGIAVPGLYQRLVDSIALCRYSVLYNWKFNGIEVSPWAVELVVSDNVVKINDYVEVDSDDVIHIFSLEPTINIISLDVSQNGEYETPTGVDGFNPVIVNVPTIESASVFRWVFGTPTTCWGIMKKQSGGVIGQNGDNVNANILLVGDLMTVTFHGTSQSVEVLATSAIKLKAYRTDRTLGPAIVTEYTMAVNDQQSFTQDNVYGGIYFEAEVV